MWNRQSPANAPLFTFLLWHMWNHKKNSKHKTKEKSSKENSFVGNFLLLASSTLLWKISTEKKEKRKCFLKRKELNKWLKAPGEIMTFGNRMIVKFFDFFQLLFRWIFFVALGKRKIFHCHVNFIEFWIGSWDYFGVFVVLKFYLLWFHSWAEKILMNIFVIGKRKKFWSNDSWILIASFDFLIFQNKFQKSFFCKFWFFICENLP